MTEFRSLIDATRVVRRRTLVNNLLHYWNRCLAWSLAGVLLATALLSLHAVLISAAMLVAVAAVIGIVAAWRSRPSAYEAACRLDAAAGLHDRLSTALHFATVDAPDEMVRHQRRDALGRLSQADPRALFTLQLPAASGRTAALALAVAGLLAYRVNHMPPLLAVSEQVAQTRLARAILTPRPPEKEKKFRERLVLSDEREAEDADLSERAGLDEVSDPEAQKGDTSSSEPGEASTSSEDQANSEEGESGEAEPNGASEDADPQAQKDVGREPANGQTGDESEPGATPQQDKSSSSSLAQKIKEALKDLLAKATGQTPKGQQNDKNVPSPPGNEPLQSQNSQQQNSQAPGARPTKSPQPDDTTKAKASGASPPMAGQQGEGNAPNGKDSGISQMSKNPTLETHPTADIVSLAATKFRGQASVLTTAQAGTALVPLRDASAPPTATTDGAEQRDVPLRYRSYLQQYFNHPDPNHPDKVQR